MTKLAPEWVRTNDPVIRSPACYRWTTAPANLDCGPFVLKIAISVPGLARKLLFNTAKSEGVSFALFRKEDEDLYRAIEQNLARGPSIVFNRHHTVGKDYIRESFSGQDYPGF